MEYKSNDRLKKSPEMNENNIELALFIYYC